MGKIKVASFSMSIDGYGTGPEQSLENPLGIGGTAVHEWFFGTQVFQTMHGDGDKTGSTGTDNEFASRGFENIGAWIMGRNMFSPLRGPWADLDWKGWWGDNPPYHTPVFVLTNHKRPSIEMAGGTTFHFVTDGIESALAKAKDAAKGKDVRIGGGVNTIRQYLEKRLIDELHLVLAPTLMGSGENLFENLNYRQLGYACKSSTPSESVLHVILTKIEV